MKRLFALLIVFCMILGNVNNMALASFTDGDTTASIYIAGDSTAESYGVKLAPLTGWAQALQGFLPKNITVRNHATSGRSSKSFIDEGRLDKILSAIKEGDYLVIQFGHNDQKTDERYTQPQTTYKEYLKQYIDKSREKGATPILVTSIDRRQFSKGIFVSSLAEYAQAMRELAFDENVTLIDLNEESIKLYNKLGEENSKQLFLILKPGESPNYPSGITDNTHLSLKGAKEIAKLFLNDLSKTSLPIAKYASYEEYENGETQEDNVDNNEDHEEILPVNPGTIEVGVDPKSRKITIVGSTGYGNEDVMVTVLNPERELPPAGYANMIDSINFMEQTKTAADGMFVFIYTMDDDKEAGTYKVLIRGGENYYETNFEYASEQQILSAINMINTSTASDVDSVLAQQGKKLGIDLELYSKLSDESKLFIGGQLVGKSFEEDMSSVEIIQSIFNKAVTVCGFIDAKSEGEIDFILKNSNGVLGLDIGENSLYGQLSKDYKIELRENMIGEIIIDELDVDKQLKKIRTIFNDNAIIITINYAPWGKIARVVEDNMSDFNISQGLKSQYNSISDKTLVYKAMAENIKRTRLTDIASIVSLFEKCVKEVLNAKPQASPPGSSGSSSKGSTVSVNPAPVGTGGVEPAPTSAPSTTFNDLDSVTWAVESINALAARGIISGFGDGTFRPEDNVTREQFLKMLVMSFGLQGQISDISFTDVNKDEWYYPYIITALSLGITNGRGDGSFGISQNINREEMVTFTYRTAMHTGASLPKNHEEPIFGDYGDIATYAVEGVIAMYRAGVIKGTSADEFSPAAYATRAQAAVVINNLILCQN